MITTTTQTTRVGDVVLHERNTEARLGLGGAGFGGAGLGIAYRRPTAVEHPGGTTPIRDVVLLVRLAALGVVLIALIVRRLST